MYRMIYDHTKEILEKESVDPEHFKRELKRASRNLSPYEMEHLKIWLSFFTREKPELKQCLFVVNE